MRFYTDEAYDETLNLLLGKAKLPPHAQALASWIGREFDVEAPGNIRFVMIKPLRIRARFEVIFKYADSAAAMVEKVRLAEIATPDLDPRPSIIDRFRTVSEGTRDEALSRLDIEVRFYSFEEPARWKVNSAMPDDQIERIEAKLAPFGVWKIFQSFDAITFLFHTDEQLIQSPRNGARDACQDIYARALSPYDGFGFFQRKPVRAHFDSRERFERDFSGSWVEYARQYS